MTACREQLLELYRTAGFGKRLDMYMQFPEVRSDFNHIEKGDGKMLPGNTSPKMAPITWQESL